MAGASECSGPTNTTQTLPASAESGHSAVTKGTCFSCENMTVGPEGAMCVDNPQTGKLLRVLKKSTHQLSGSWMPFWSQSHIPEHCYSDCDIRSLMSKAP